MTKTEVTDINDVSCLIRYYLCQLFEEDNNYATMSLLAIIQLKFLIIN